MQIDVERLALGKKGRVYVCVRGGEGLSRK